MMRTMVGLMVKGLPWELVDAMRPAVREAVWIMIAELESGKQFDFASGALVG